MAPPPWAPNQAGWPLWRSPAPGVLSWGHGEKDDPKSLISEPAIYKEEPGEQAFQNKQVESRSEAVGN